MTQQHGQTGATASSSSEDLRARLQQLNAELKVELRSGSTSNAFDGGRVFGTRQCLDRIESLLSACPPSAGDAPAWRPIETHDGRREGVLLYFPAAARSRLSPMVKVDSYPPPYPRQPTHWMPLPASPSLLSGTTTEEKNKTKNFTRGHSFPDSAHGDLPRRNDGDD